MKKTILPQLYKPQTNIINPPTLLTRNLNLDLYNDKRPQIVILEDKDLLRMDELFTMTKGRYLMCFQSNDQTLVKTFVKTMHKQKNNDFFIITSQMKVIKEAKKHNPYSKIIYQVNTLDGLNDIYEIPIRRLLLHKDLITKERVSNLQLKTFTVYADVHNLIERENALLSGVNGIITDDVIPLINHLESFTKPTHIRDIHFISHRGLHDGYKDSYGPENSLEAATQAVKHGARMVEIDIHLTLDHEVVVIHDEKTHRVSDYKRIVKKTPLQQLQQTPLKKTSLQKEYAYIQSLEDFLKPFIDEDVFFFIETKAASKELIKNSVAILKANNLINRFVFISFYAKNIYYQYQNGFKSGFLYTKNILKEDVQFFLDEMAKYSASYNPHYSHLSEQLVFELTTRGITIWPWTADYLDTYQPYHLGIGGITTNTIDFIKDEYLYALAINQTIPLKTLPQTVNIINYTLSQNKKEVEGKLIILDDGGTGIKVDNNHILSAIKPGIITMYAVINITLKDGRTHDKTTNIFKVELT